MDIVNMLIRGQGGLEKCWESWPKIGAKKVGLVKVDINQMLENAR